MNFAQKESSYYTQRKCSWLLGQGKVDHCTKNHISHVLEYHEKLKKTKYVLSFYQHLGWKKDHISHHRKVQNKSFSLISKYHLSINLLIKKKTVFPITEKFETRTFQ